MKTMANSRTSPRPLPKRGSPASLLRSEIENAESDGVGREDMTLRLTLGDAVKLKRDPNLAVTDISYAGGVMRFLGVRIEQGGVAASVLDRGDA